MDRCMAHFLVVTTGNEEMTPKNNKLLWYCLLTFSDVAIEKAF